MLAKCHAVVLVEVGLDQSDATDPDADLKSAVVVMSATGTSAEVLFSMRDVNASRVSSTFWAVPLPLKTTAVKSSYK